MRATVRPGAATDATGNVSLASTSADNTVSFQQQAALTVSATGPGGVNPGTGQYPLGPRDFIVNVYRYGLRVQAYVGLLTDQYPPFALRA